MHLILKVRFGRFTGKPGGEITYGLGSPKQRHTHLLGIFELEPFRKNTSVIRDQPGSQNPFDGSRFEHGMTMQKMICQPHGGLTILWTAMFRLIQTRGPFDGAGQPPWPGGSSMGQPRKNCGVSTTGMAGHARPSCRPPKKIRVATRSIQTPGIQT